MNRFEQLDVTAFDRYFSGIEHNRSVALYLKLASLFLKSLDGKLIELSTALSADQRQDARVIAHRIRGSLLSLGGNHLAKMFYEIESVLSSEENSEGKVNHQGLLILLTAKQTEIQQFVDELNAWMETLEASVNTAH